MLIAPVGLRSVDTARMRKKDHQKHQTKDSGQNNTVPECHRVFMKWFVHQMCLLGSGSTFRTDSYETVH